jgi:choline dehydrogenase-like flavoprotein
VLVVERGPLADPPQFTHREVPTFRRLYLDGGMLTTRNRRVALLAGSCLGGGTVVNYTTSLRLPDDVRKEWARVSGLDLFTSTAFTEAMDAVCARLSVNLDHNRPSRRDELMARGLAALGWHHDRMPRNVVGCSQDDVCGYCGFGCIRDAKQSMLATYLIDAWSHGARFLVECAAERVVVERGRARGIVARTRDGRTVRVAARAVVVAAGAIHTPALLLRSGLGGPIGKRIYLHPVVAAWGHFDERVEPWNGTIQAIYSEELARLHRGYGVRFETAPVHPALFALALPWAGANEFDRAMRELPRTSFVGVLLRDRVGGGVTIDREGAPLVSYRLSRYDRRHLRRGLAGAARVLQAAGATSVVTHDALYASFHQMGTCPMGRHPRSVVNDTGRTHEVPDLYVADASLFPTASGVNPMITIAALAYHVAQEVKARLA